MVYGAQPASASVYNLKANVIAEFGTGARNFASFSPSGHLLTLAGFGSLKGNNFVFCFLFFDYLFVRRCHRGVG
jgi:uncharacterized protein with WD repeat